MMSIVPQNHPTATEAASRLSEREYLKLEQSRAAAAMGNAWRRARKNLLYSADPRTATRKHPWIALGSAVVIGFGASKLLGREDRHDRDNPQAPTSNGNGRPSRRNRRRVRWLLKTLEPLRPLILNLISAASSSAVAPPPPPAQQPASTPPTGN